VRAEIGSYRGELLRLLRGAPLVDLQAEGGQLPPPAQDVVPAGGERRARRKQHREHLGSGVVRLLQGTVRIRTGRLRRVAEPAGRGRRTFTSMSAAETSTVTDSSSGARLSLPTSRPASRAAPMAMTSSGGAELRSSTSGTASRIICWRRGILPEPPQRTTCRTQRAEAFILSKPVTIKIKARSRPHL